MTTLATAFVEIRPDTDAFGRKLTSDVSKAGKTAGGNFGRVFASTSMGPMRALGVAAAGLFAANQVGNFFGGAIRGASDLGESVNAVNVTFGKNAEGIARLGRQAAESVGLSRLEFQNLSVQFSAFASTIAGPGGDVVATMDELTTRGADFASVMNLDVNQAMSLFQSGLAGETEPLRKFGIDLSAAAVQAHAYKTGIAESGAELSENQKVQARYSLLMAQTAKTQGDFTNTSDSLANSQRRLGAHFDNIRATVGAALIPILERLSAWAVNTGIPAFREFATWFQANALPALRSFGNFISGELVPSLQAMGQWIGRNTSWLIPLTAAIATAVVVFRTVIAVTKAWAAAQMLLNVAMTLNPIGLVIAAIAGLVVGLVIAYKRSETFRNIVNKAFAAVKNVVGGVINWFRTDVPRAFSTVQTAISNTMTAARNVVTGAWNGIKSAFRTAGDFIVDTIRAIPGKIKALGGAFMDAGRAIIGKLVDGLKNAGGLIGGIAGNVWDAVRGMLNSAITRINAALSFTINPPGPGSLTINPPDIPHLAMGTNFFGGGLAMVGEHGPELVTLPRGTKVTPNHALAGGGVTPTIHIENMHARDEWAAARALRAEMHKAAVMAALP